MIISRWWHRKGFGIQSPWAYSLVTEVLCHKDNLRQRLQEYLGDTPRWVLIDDIRHTGKAEWKSIVADPSATATFDMRNKGLAVYDPKRYKQHYEI